MPTLTFNRGSLDRLAIGLSGLCLAHCLATAVLVTAFASIGGLLVSPIIHVVGLSLAMLLASIALGRGVLEHGYAIPAWVGSLGLGIMGGAMSLGHGAAETTFSIIGVLIVALGHDLNRRAGW